MSVTPVAGNKFTDEMLARNFASISSAFFEFENWSEKVDKQLAAVTKLASTKPSKVKPFLIGAVVGVVAYRYLTQNIDKVDVAVERVKNGVQEQVDEMRNNSKDTPNIPSV